MGWKLFSIIYKTKDKKESELIKQIENGTKAVEFLKVGKKSFGECMNPKEGFLYISKYKDFLIINDADIVVDFFQNPASKTERFWRSLSINGKNIYCFMLESVSCMYGFAYISNQRKIRCKWGTLDDSIILDIGSPLEPEKEFYKKEQIDALIEEGEIEFHQIGENLVFHLMANILGEESITNSELMNLQMTEYKKVILDDFEYKFF